MRGLFRSFDFQHDSCGTYNDRFLILLTTVPGTVSTGIKAFTLSVTDAPGASTPSHVTAPSA